MGQPWKMFVLGNDIIKAVFQERREKQIPSNLHISPHYPHYVMDVGFSHLRQNLPSPSTKKQETKKKLMEIERRQILIYYNEFLPVHDIVQNERTTGKQVTNLSSG